MKATFEDFIKENAVCAKYFDNRDARRLFEFIAQEDNIISMIEACDVNKPALSGIITGLEDYAISNTNLKLEDSFVRKMIGRMIRVILAPFGYIVCGQKIIPKSFHSKFFSTASCYAQSGIPTMKVVKRIESIEAVNEIDDSSESMFVPVRKG